MPSICHPQNRLTASDIKEHFEAAGEQITSVRLFEFWSHCYGAIDFHVTSRSKATFENPNLIHGVAIELFEQPNMYHIALESHEEVTGTPILWLVDDCLQKVFSYLDVDDMCSVAHVCHRFRFNAQEQFSRQHVGVQWNESGNGSTPSLRQFSEILRTFGAHIDLLGIVSPQSQERVMALALRYCGPSLHRLYLEDMDIESDLSIQTLRLLCTRLHYLKIDDCELPLLRLMSFCLELKELHLSEVNVVDADIACSAFQQNYPQLETATFYCVTNLTATHYVEFLKMNRQLKCLKVTLKDVSILHAIAECVLLEELELHFEIEDTEDESVGIDLDSDDISIKLKGLKRFSLIGDSTAHHMRSASTILKAVAGAQLEYLGFSFIPLNGNPIIETICNIETIKQLDLEGTTIQYDQLLRVCNSLPHLEKLHMRFCHETFESNDQLVSIIKSAKNLRRLEIGELLVDVDTFQKIVDILSQREKRIPLNIIRWTHQADEEPSNEFMDAHKELLTIEIKRIPVTIVDLLF